MHRTRRVLTALAALAVVLSAAPARAASCPTATDPTGDTGVPGYELAAIQPRPWDLVSADLATGPTSLVAVVRVAGMGTADYVDNTVFFDTDWRPCWLLDGNRQYVEFRVSSGALNSVYWYDGAAAPMQVPVTLDRAAGTVSWTLPRATVHGLVPGAAFASLNAVTYYFSSSVDQAATPGTFFTDGTTGCIPARSRRASSDAGDTDAGVGLVPLVDREQHRRQCLQLAGQA